MENSRNGRQEWEAGAKGQEQRGRPQGKRQETTYRVLRSRRIVSGRVILRLTSVPLRWILTLPARVVEIVGVVGHL